MLSKGLGVNAAYVMLFTVVHFLSCARADEHEYRLVSDLMRSYDKSIRPSLNASHPLNVTFGVALAQIIDVVRRDVTMFLYLKQCRLLIN